MTTPDRFPGIRQDEEIKLDTNESPGGGAGSVSFDGSGFRLEDASGFYNPRPGAGSLTEEQHRVLRQLIHFIEDGPAEGFLSGCYKETSSAGPFPTSEIWWESSSKLKKIVSLDTTWTGVKITQEVWKIYATDGSTVLVTITDDISYTGVFESSRTRTIA